jgi:hypothetical protein
MEKIYRSLLTSSFHFNGTREYDKQIKSFEINSGQNESYE